MEKKAILALHNGLFFIHGNEDLLIIPEIGTEQIKPIRSENCIIVFAQHAVDGMTEITISSDVKAFNHTNLSEIFCDKISLKNKIIISDPEGNLILELESETPIEKIEIYADDIEYPTKIKILVI